MLDGLLSSVNDMQNVTLVFTNSRKILSRLISIVTWSKWSHVAIYCHETDTVIEAVGSGVREIQLKEFLSDKRKWEFVEFPVNDRKGVIEYCRSQIGMKYDFSALFGIFFKRDIENKNKWFCSELVNAALVEDGSSPFRKDFDSRITPSHLNMIDPSSLKRHK